MRVEPDTPRRMGEQRRYFPDWTARLLERCPELEADHNSYLAGGYAEEFGYRAQPGCSRGVTVLDGECPEECSEWQGQAQVTHPGYPIRPHPLEIDVERSRQGDQRKRVHDSERATYKPEDAARHGMFVPVSDRPYERMRHDVSQRTAAASRRLAAALVGLRWKLGRGR